VRAEGGPFSWLRAYSPIERVGKSILLYHIDVSAPSSATRVELLSPELPGAPTFSTPTTINVKPHPCRGFAPSDGPQCGL
jgi:hypothetical protein